MADSNLDYRMNSNIIEMNEHDFEVVWMDPSEKFGVQETLKSQKSSYKMPLRLPNQAATPNAKLQR